jgi:hypothetical protein
MDARIADKGVEHIQALDLLISIVDKFGSSSATKYLKVVVGRCRVFEDQDCIDASGCFQKHRGLNRTDLLSFCRSR